MTDKCAVFKFESFTYANTIRGRPVRATTKNENKEDIGGGICYNLDPY
jgi:hypothetical protein